MGDYKHGVASTTLGLASANDSVAGDLSQVPKQEEIDFLTIFLDLLRIFTGVVGLVANSVLFIVYRTFSSLNSPANQFIISLAINDVISICSDLGFILLRYVYPDFFSDSILFCLIDNLGIFLTAINMSQLAAIALERYLFITTPLRYYGLISRWKNVLIATSWLAPTVVFLPLVVGLQCRQAHYSVFMGLLGLYLLVGFVAIASLYCVVYVTAHTQMKMIVVSYPHMAHQPHSHDDLRHNIKLLIGYFVIVGTTFIVYSLPVGVFFAYILSPSSLPTLTKIQRFSGPLATLNNSINPFVYFFSQQTFKDSVQRLFQRQAREELLTIQCLASKTSSIKLSSTAL